MLLCLVVFFFSWKLGFRNQWENLLSTVSMLMLFIFPSTLLILFVRKQILILWSFIVFFVVIAEINYLLSRDTLSHLFGGSDRSQSAFGFGICLFVITLAWSIIHTLILRHQEKRELQGVVK